ncbi:uncharacterized protein LOC129039069 [Pongo pygmaeus]|uniref:uncharacterized protein LOC129039069 n=1 Tax=Pongo pygmaeus TaxID=9600 RepID=UPI00300CDC67
MRKLSHKADNPNGGQNSGLSISVMPPGTQASLSLHRTNRVRDHTGVRAAAAAAAAAAGPADCEETAVPPGPRTLPFPGSRLAPRPREARSSGSGGDPAGSARLRRGKQPRALLPPALCRRQPAEPTAGAPRAQQLLSPGSKGGRRDEPVAMTQTPTPIADPAELLGSTRLVSDLLGVPLRQRKPPRRATGCHRQHAAGPARGRAFVGRELAPEIVGAFLSGEESLAESDRSPAHSPGGGHSNRPC